MAAKRPPGVRARQRGRLLSDVYASGTSTAPSKVQPRPAQRGTSRAARASRTASPSPPLDVGDLVTVIQNFVELLEGLYAHLPLKRAMYAVDPLQRLRLLAQRAPSLDASALHGELAGILTRLRDAHTRYVGPTRLAEHVAMLPFLVESYGEPPKPGYIVSAVADNRSLIDDRRFAPGVELLYWNAVPMDRAVDLYAELETGGRPDSRRARALESLTLRSLQYGPPPDEHWVVVGYRDLRGAEREVRIPWRVIEPGRARTAGFAGAGSARRFAMDPGREAARRAKTLLFAPKAWKAGRSRAARATKKAATRTPRLGSWIDTEFADAVGAKRVKTASGVFGYLRLWSFDVADDEGFVAEVIRLLELLPEDGLIIDLRANPGGLIWAAERLLQLFGPQSIAPTRFSLLATSLTRAMARAPQNELDLEPWRESLDEALATGEPYSQPVPITPLDRCNDIGQVYGGPVVAVADANTYSAGDLFAAGFYDNDLGILVTVGEATGAGGANVWWPDQVQKSLLSTAFEQQPLPAGIGYSISVRRATRGAGPAIGTPIEDVGVRGHRRYPMTKDDLIGGNQDLLDFCGALLADRPSTQLRVSLPDADARSIEVATGGLDRLDLYVDDRPEGSNDVVDGRTRLDLPAGWKVLALHGYTNGQLRQRRRIEAP